MIAFILYAMSMLSTPVYADTSPDWLCTHTASQISDHVIKTCGVAESANEAVARSQSLDNAHTEFEAICEKNEMCHNHKYDVAPLRMECEKTKQGLTHCVRLMVYNISDTIVVTSNNNVYHGYLNYVKKSQASQDYYNDQWKIQSAAYARQTQALSAEIERQTKEFQSK